MPKRPTIERAFLVNTEIAELLATEAETAKQPLQKALRRAARRAFLWPEEAAQLVRQGRCGGIIRCRALSEQSHRSLD